LHGQQEWLTESLSCSRDASQELTRITVPTSLIWGRHDRVMRLRIAQAASARYGWPLHVIEDAGHFLDRAAGGVPGGAAGRARRSLMQRPPGTSSRNLVVVDDRSRR
jgi:pimeloyl-ACP methyl ester carboxylesterase